MTNSTMLSEDSDRNWQPIYHMESVLLGWYDYCDGEYHYESAATGMSWIGDDYDGIVAHLLSEYTAHHRAKAGHHTQ